MMELEAIADLLPDMDVIEITSWVDRGWVVPERDGTRLVFQAIDVARIRLIRDMRAQMALGEDSIPVVLSLVDQVYELRAQLRSILRALETQPAEVRGLVTAALGHEGSPESGR